MNVNLHIDNHALVEECRNGDKEALNLFYLRFAPRMLCVIRRYITEPKDAEDILHDGFIVAFTRLGSLRDPDKVEYWLATIMRNLALQFLQNQDVVEILHDIPEVEEAPEIEDIIDLETLEMLMRKLPAGYQKVFRLAVLENKSHKEIGRLLGIAPNSSSSQLFHARMMMRRLIAEYKAGVLTVMLAGVLLFLFLRFGNDDVAPLLSDAEESVSLRSDFMIPERDEEVEEIVAPERKSATEKPFFAESEGSHSLPDGGKPEERGVVLPESVGNMIADAMDVAPETPVEAGNKDSRDVPSVVEPLISEEPVGEYYDSRVVIKEKSRWAIGGGVSFNIDVSNLASKGDLLCCDFNNNFWTGDSETDSSDGDKTPTTRSWPGATVDKTMQNLMEASHKNDQPISFSLAVSRSVSDLISLETGLTYTYLHSTFETLMSESDCRWHYLGIPLKVKFKTVGGKRWRLYASAGLEFEIPLVAKSVVSTSFSQPDLYYGRFRAYSLWTASASYGFSYRLTDKINVFIEPTLQYRFHHKYKVPNVWTDDRIGFTLPIGFRFDL